MLCVAAINCVSLVVYVWDDIVSTRFCIDYPTHWTSVLPLHHSTAVLLKLLLGLEILVRFRYNKYAVSTAVCSLMPAIRTFYHKSVEAFSYCSCINLYVLDCFLNIG